MGTRKIKTEGIGKVTCKKLSNLISQLEEVKKEEKKKENVDSLARFLAELRKKRSLSDSEYL